MFINNENALRSHLKGALAHCYYLYGLHDYLVHSYANRIAERSTGGDKGEWAIQRFDMSRDTMDAVCDAALSVSFFGGAKCLLLTAFRTDELSPDDMAKLLELIPLLSDGVTLVIEGAEAPKKQGKVNLYTVVSEYGVLVELSGKDRGELVKFCQHEAQANGATIRAAACDYLMGHVTDNMQALSTEIAKLAAYVGGGEILPEHIDRLCTEKLELRVFEIAKALVRRDLAAAYRQVEAMRELHEEPIYALAALESAFVDLYRVKVSEISRKSLSQVASDFGYRNAGDFKLTRAASDSQRLSVAYLRVCLDILMQCDNDMKLLRTDRYQLFQQAMTRMLEARQSMR